MKKRMINTNCHGCKQPMSFEAVPLTITEMTGKRTTHYGKDSAVWICKPCRLEPAKLKAARAASGLGDVSLPEGFDADE